MGRNRSSTKKDLTLWIDEEIIEKLKEYEINKSLLFTDAAKEFIADMEEKTKNSNNDEK